MTGDKLALGAVAALAALSIAKRRGSRALPPGGKEKLVELVKAGHVDQARALSESLGVTLDLSGANLWGVIITSANLSGADLRDVDLTYSDLRGANLSGASLRGANLTGIRYTIDSTWPDIDTTWPDGFTPPPSRKK